MAVAIVGWRPKALSLKTQSEKKCQTKNTQAHKIGNFIRCRNQSTCLTQQMENSNVTHSKVHVGGCAYCTNMKSFHIIHLMVIFSYFFLQGYNFFSHLSARHKTRIPRYKLLPIMYFHHDCVCVCAQISLYTYDIYTRTHMNQHNQ